MPNGPETPNLEELAAAFLQNNGMGTPSQQQPDIQSQIVAALGGSNSQPTPQQPTAPVSQQSAPKNNEPPSTIHPAWKEVLDQIPEELHPAVIPTLQKWDTNVSRRFQRYHDTIEPVKDLLEEMDPDSLRQAAEIYQNLITDPSATWESIGRAFSLSPNPQQGSSLDDDLEDLELPPALVKQLSRLSEIDEIKQALNVLVSRVQEQDSAAEDEEAEAELDEYLKDLHNDYGDFDEDYVTALIGAGWDGDEAVEKAQQLASRYAPQPPAPNRTRQSSPPVVPPTQQPSAPIVLKGAGGVPTSEVPNFAKLSTTDRKKLVAEILGAAQTQG